MPGILPMKVIKVGNSSQSRVAQACDRCRSKKIRCDGIRPCCSQCANVGFECKTSDKLSRRAFPRGYTESLEDRVRSLEAEVRELKCLLDEKDEKIDVLSRLHSFSPSSRKSSSASASSSSAEENNAPSSNNNDRDDLIQVQQPTSILRKPTHDSPFTGPSSTKAFIDAFSSKLEKSGRSPAAVSVDALLSPPSLSAWKRQDAAPKTPPRLVSDQLLNIFFQEWAPLYPVVHRPAILKLYGRYTTNPDSIEDDKYALAQLNLIFGIAAISSTTRVPQDPSVFERNWTPKLEVLANDISLTALQCYILAQIYYSIKSDYKNLLRYRGIGVSICLQLGLNQSQKKFSFNPLMGETRKKVFWCQYTLDRFSAALTGLPTIMAESDISTEFPANVDDENVTETGFVPTPPEEATRMSSALALFSVSRILNKVLERLYPSSTGYEISLSTIHSLAEELEDWLKKLPSHLRLEFAQDKPSASTGSSRSPLLSIVFYYIRTLIRRPAVCFGKPNNASPSMLSLVDSGKHIIQLLKLLDERRMSLAISINKRELIFVTGLSILWQSMDLSRESKLVKEGQKVLTTAINLLESESAEAAAEFGGILSSVVQMDIPRRNSASSLQLNQEMAAPPLKSNSPKRQLEPLRTQFTFSAEACNSARVTNDMRRASGPTMSPGLSRSVRSSSSHSLSSVEDHGRPLKIQCVSGESASDPPMNLDYMPTDEKDKKQISPSYGPGMGMSEWEHVLSDIDSGHANIFTGIYGGSECGQTPAAFATLGSNFPQQQQQHHQHQHQQQPQQPQQPQQQHHQSSPVSILPSSARSINEWSPEPWSSTSSNSMQQAHPTTTSASGAAIPATQPGFPEERRLSSRDGGVPNGAAVGNNMNNGLNPVQHRNSISRAPPLDPYEAIVIPHNMDSMDTSNEFNVAETWVPQCVM